MRKAAHPSGCASCGAGAGCLAIKYHSLWLAGVEVRNAWQGLRGLPRRGQGQALLLSTGVTREYGHVPSLGRSYDLRPSPTVGPYGGVCP